MPDPTQEFSRYWRRPIDLEGLNAQNEALDTLLDIAEEDIKHFGEMLTDELIEGEGFGLMPDMRGPEWRRSIVTNYFLRVAAIGLLAAAEAHNAVLGELNLAFHPMTLTPQRLRDALERTEA